MTCLVLYLTGHMFDYLRAIVWLIAPYTVIRTRLFSNGTLPPYKTGLSAGVCGLTPKSVILCIYIIPRYDPGSTSYAVKCCIAFPRPNILESLSPAAYPGTNRSVKWRQKRIPHSISYLETWSIAPDMRQTAYCSLTRSGMEYCSSVWDPHLQKDKVRLEKVNRLTDEPPELSSIAPGETPTWAPLPYYTNYSGPPWRPADITSGCALCTRYHTGLLQCHLLARLIPPARNLRGHARKYQHISTTCDPAKFSFSHGAYLNGIS